MNKKSGDPKADFEETRKQRIAGYPKNSTLQNASSMFLIESARAGYSYNFSWMGVPIIQYPQDIVALQEIIWDTKPTVIVETGVAHGGSIIFHASMLEILGHGKIIGIDIDIRPHNRKAIEAHPMSKRIVLIEGSSIDQNIKQQVSAHITAADRVMVVLDSNHTHAHVLSELEMYSPLVSKGCYLVVFDTAVEDVPADLFADRPWEVGNNPKTAVWEFVKKNPDFEIDKAVHEKLLVTVAPDGYLRRIR